MLAREQCLDYTPRNEKKNIKLNKVKEQQMPKSSVKSIKCVVSVYHSKPRAKAKCNFEERNF